MANTGTFEGTQVSGAAADEPELCRVSGFLRDVGGAPLAGAVLTLRHVYNPVGVAPSTLVVRERRTVRTDVTGYVSFDLYRGAQVDVEIPNLLMEFTCHCVVPDAASIDLVAFLFPYLVSVAWEDDADLELGEGESLSLVLVGTLSNGESVDIENAATIVSGDSGVATVSTDQVVSGVGVGTTTLTVTGIDTEDLGLQQKPDGTILAVFDMPSPTLPSPRTVNVS